MYLSSSNDWSDRQLTSRPTSHPAPPEASPPFRDAEAIKPSTRTDEQLPLPGLLEGEDASRFSTASAIAVKAVVKKILRWKRDGFPGGQPVSLSLQNVTELFRNPYVACEKTDGIRFLLYGSNRRIYLIGRRDEVREVAEMYLPRAVDLREAQEMTLLDGELVMDRREGGGFLWRYLIYDCMCLEGDEELQRMNLLRRLQAAKKFVTEPLARLREVQRRQAPDASRSLSADSQQPCGLEYMANGGFSGLAPAESAQKNPPLEIYLKARQTFLRYLTWRRFGEWRCGSHIPRTASSLPL
ncbi:mRNA capping protein [Cyclospora cayetanensis]|uniref:mRNA capping protein n=1 Tax=Cyclospora cayetanensis TaxID=88456 RepID=A0A1D3D3L3_9EIME|nr:mRNA capping protein [Cyclospora cayetanensis]